MSYPFTHFYQDKLQCSRITVRFLLSYFFYLVFQGSYLNIAELERKCRGINNTVEYSYIL